MATAISIKDLVKTFGAVPALDSFNMEVNTGEVHGFLGPNGAGKSTALRVLLGLLRADRGRVSVLGSDPWRDAVELHRRLAYVPGDVTLWPELTGGEAIDVLGRLRGGTRFEKAQGAHRSLRSRSHQESSYLFQGQPAEGRDRRCVGF